jgi:hypothetical protein
VLLAPYFEDAKNNLANAKKLQKTTGTKILSANIQEQV